MKAKTQFAVYTSFYNCENYIDQLFENVLSLNYENWKWFVTDDFSSDNTKQKLLDKIDNNPKIEYVNQSRKKEMYWQPNKFIPTEFEYILLVCSDDKIDPEILSVYDSLIRKYKSEVAVLTCDLQEIHEDSGQIKSLGYVYNRGSFIEKVDSYFPKIDYINNLGYFAFGLGMCFKNYPDLNFVVKDYLASSEDFYRILFLTSIGNWLHVPRNLYTWNARKDSESRKEIEKNFYANLDIAFGRHKYRSCETILDYNPVYKELNSLMIENNLSRFKKISIISPWISKSSENLIKEIFPDKEVLFNETSGAEIYSIIANYNLEGQSLEVLVDQIKAQNSSGRVIIYYLDETVYFSDKEVLEGPIEIMKKIESKIGNKISSWFFFIYLRHINFAFNL